MQNNINQKDINKNKKTLNVTVVNPSIEGRSMKNYGQMILSQNEDILINRGGRNSLQIELAEEDPYSLGIHLKLQD